VRFVSALALALAACAAPSPEPPPPPQRVEERIVEVPRPCPEPIVNTEIRWVEVTRDSELEKLLLYLEKVRELSPAELAREYEELKENFYSNRSEYLRMQLAVLASLPNTGFRDETRALNLLEPFLKDQSAQSQGLRAFAVYLNSTILEQRKLDELVKTAAQKLKDEQKRADVMETKLREEQKRSEQLENKLEALKAIEKSLMEREGARK
jgi:hypothetical protein